jgi:hypothetical protein
MNALGINGQPFESLRPGDYFQPCFLDVPSRPRADFLWSGSGSLVVSQRIRNLLLEYCPAHVSVCPINLRKIGKRNATLPPPIPSTGEPEDMVEQTPSSHDLCGVGPYFEVVIRDESSLPEGYELLSVCSGCRLPKINKANRLLRMTDSMWRGQQIFFLATTLYIVVTDALKQKIEGIGATNVTFEDLSWTEWTFKR